MSTEERHERERKARRDAILQAASRVFARHGLDAATIEMVAREAEVAVGTIYLYFSSRDDLYLSLVVERAAHLKARYVEIQARGLDALAELRAITAAYLEHLGDTREIMLSQQSVGYAQLHSRLRRPTELRHFKRVMDLSHQVWELWERTVRRCIDAGLIANAMGTTRTAAVMWATLNGAFMLMGDGSYFRDVTGLNPADFVDDALESHLTGRIRTAAASRRKQSSNGVAHRGRAKVVKEKETGAPAEVATA